MSPQPGHYGGYRISGVCIRVRARAIGLKTRTMRTTFNVGRKIRTSREQTQGKKVAPVELAAPLIWSWDVGLCVPPRLFDWPPLGLDTSTGIEVVNALMVMVVIAGRYGASR
jgi:hypothetical protein